MKKLIGYIKGSVGCAYTFSDDLSSCEIIKAQQEDLIIIMKIAQEESLHFFLAGGSIRFYARADKPIKSKRIITHIKPTSYYGY